MKEKIMAQQNLIFKAVVGSRLYGTDTANSDKDFVGIFIPDKEYVMGMHTCEIVEDKTNPSDSGHRNDATDVDTVYYSLPKFIKLATDNNPNILELFFVPDELIVHNTQFGRELIDSYPLFISKKLVPRFLGYAQAQKHKVLHKNPIGDRKKYIEQFGYDVKFASHIIRLLDEGLELLNTGNLSYPLTRAHFIKAIKNGELPWEDVLKNVDKLEEQYKETATKSFLQELPNIKEIEHLQIDMLERFWKQQIDDSFYNRTKELGW